MKLRAYLPSRSHSAQLGAFATLVAGPALYGIVAARWLGPTDRGLLVAVTSTVSIAGLLGTAGTPTELRRQTIAGAREALGPHVRFAALGGACVGSIGAALLLSTQNELTLQDAVFIPVLSCIAAIAVVFREVLFGIGRIALSNWVFGLAYLGQIAPLFMLHEAGESSLLSALAINLVAALAALAILAWAWRHGNLEQGQGAEFTRAVTSTERLSILPLLSSQYFAAGDRLVLAMVSTPDQVAFYSIGATLAFIPGLLVNASLPTLQNAAARGSSTSRSRLAALVAVSLSLFVLIACFASPLISWLFGPMYAPSVDVARVILFASIPMLAVGALLSRLIGRGRYIAGSLVATVGMATNMALVIALGQWGAIGAAWALVVTAFVSLALGIAFVRKR